MASAAGRSEAGLNVAKSVGGLIGDVSPDASLERLNIGISSDGRLRISLIRCRYLRKVSKRRPATMTKTPAVPINA